MPKRLQDSDIDLDWTPRRDIRRCLKFSPAPGQVKASGTSDPAMPVYKKQAARPVSRAKMAVKENRRKTKRLHKKTSWGHVKYEKEEAQVDTVCMDVALHQLKLARPSKHHIMEFYSQPRLVPRAHEFGMKGSISLDVVHGWDALKPSHRQIAQDLLGHCKPSFLMCSPPCTFWSALMTMWNFKKMKPQEIAARRGRSVCRQLFGTTQ